MAEYNWPTAVLKPRDSMFNLNERTLGTQPSVAGYTQVVADMPPIWTATYGNIFIRTQAQRLAFRALATLLKGRQNTVIVQMCGGDQPVPPGYDGTESVPHSDDSPHDDDTPYDQTAISALVAADATAGAVVVTVNASAIGDVQAGHHFSISHRLYRITGVVNNGGGSYDLSIWPPLRADISAGEMMEFDNPSCRMRLATDQEMNLDLQYGRFGTPTVRFIEDFS